MNSKPGKDRVAVVAELSDAIALLLAECPFENNLHQKWLKSDVVNTAHQSSA